jgi:CRP/FNR family transcriptional regulator
MQCCEHNCATCTGKYCAEKVSIFSVLNKEQLAKLLSMITHRKYSRGQVIFFEGDMSDRLYIINRGKAKIYTYTKEGKEQILYLVSEGDFIGDLSLLKKDKYEFNAEALEETNVCMLSKDDFDRVIRENPGITLNILEYVHDRIQRLERLIQTLSTKDVEARIAGLLISFAKEFSHDDKDGLIIELPINREEMANYIGVTRETISRKLASLQDENIIELVGNKKIIIKDMELLEEMI